MSRRRNNRKGGNPRDRSPEEDGEYGHERRKFFIGDLPLIPIRRNRETGVIERMIDTRDENTGRKVGTWSTEEIPENVLANAELKIPKDHTTEPFWYWKKDGRVVGKILKDRICEFEKESNNIIAEKFQEECNKIVDDEAAKMIEDWKITAMYDEVRMRLEEMKKAERDKIDNLVAVRAAETHVQIVDKALDVKYKELVEENKKNIAKCKKLASDHAKAIAEMQIKIDKANEVYTKSEEFKKKMKILCDKIFTVGVEKAVTEVFP